MARKNKSFLKIQNADRINMLTYNYYLNRLIQLACTRFEWVNLPETIDERYMEMGLFYNGQMIFFKDDVLGYLCLKTLNSGTWNVYDVPTSSEAYSTTNYRKKLTVDDSVIIYNNYMRIPNTDIAELFSYKLTNISRTIDVHVDNFKRPYVIKCSENERLTFKNLMQQVSENEPLIFGDKGLNLNDIEVFKLLSANEFVGDKLCEIQEKTLNEYLTALGITNVSYQKKERLISDEVKNSQGGAISSRFSPLQMRKQACEQINKMFNLNVDVKYRDINGQTDGYVNDLQRNGGELNV